MAADLPLYTKPKEYDEEGDLARRRMFKSNHAPPPVFRPDGDLPVCLPSILEPAFVWDLSHLRAATLTSVEGRSIFSVTNVAMLIPLTVALSTPLTLFF